MSNGVKVKIGKFDISQIKKEGIPYGKKYIVGENFIYYKSDLPLFKIEVLLKNLHKEPELYLNKLETKIFKTHRLICFFNALEAVKNNFALLHAAAVANQNGGYVFSAPQDIGKTSTALALLKEGYYLLGDDLVGLSKGGTIFRKQKKAEIFPHKNDSLFFSLSLKEKILCWLKHHLVNRSPFYYFISSNLKINYERIGKVKDASPLKKVFFLERGKPKIIEIEKEKAIDKLFSTSYHDYLFPERFGQKLYYTYCYFNNFDPLFLEKKYYEILSSALEGKKFFILKGKNYLDFHKLFLDQERN